MELPAEWKERRNFTGEYAGCLIRAMYGVRAPSQLWAKLVAQRMVELRFRQGHATPRDNFVSPAAHPDADGSRSLFLFLFFRLWFKRQTQLQVGVQT